MDTALLEITAQVFYSIGLGLLMKSTESGGACPGTAGWDFHISVIECMLS